MYTPRLFKAQMPRFLCTVYTYSTRLRFGIAYTDSFGTDTHDVSAPAPWDFLVPKCLVLCRVHWAVQGFRWSIIVNIVGWGDIRSYIRPYFRDSNVICGCAWGLGKEISRGVLGPNGSCAREPTPLDQIVKPPTGQIPANAPGRIKLFRDIFFPYHVRNQGVQINKIFENRNFIILVFIKSRKIKMVWKLN